MAGKPSPVSGRWENVIRNVVGCKRVIDIDPAGHNEGFVSKARCFLWLCEGETMVIMHATLGMGCVDILEQ